MKTLLFILLSFSNLLFPQSGDITTATTSSSSVPPKIVMTAFTGSNPNVKPAWTFSDDNTYSAAFTDEATNMGRIIIYDSRGNLIAVENELHNSAYPAAIATYFIKTYPKEKYKVWSFYDTNDRKTYFINREQETVWFDRDGKFVEVVKKKNQLITRKS